MSDTRRADAAARSPAPREMRAQQWARNRPSVSEASTLQAEMIARMRADSFIGPSVPFLCDGSIVAARPEAGLSVHDYYKRKHESLPPGVRRCGRFCDLHHAQIVRPRWS
jgi:hypothetical protein